MSVRKQSKLLTQRYPILYLVALWCRRFVRYCDWYICNRGKIIDTELITKNFARVSYTPETYEEEDIE